MYYGGIQKDVAAKPKFDDVLKVNKLIIFNKNYFLHLFNEEEMSKKIK